MITTGPMCEDNFHHLCSGEFMTKQQIDAYNRSDDSVYGRKKKKTRCKCSCHFKKKEK